MSTTTDSTIVSYVLLKRSIVAGSAIDSGVSEKRRRARLSPKRLRPISNSTQISAAMSGIITTATHRGAVSPVGSNSNGSKPRRSSVTVGGRSRTAKVVIAIAAATSASGSHLRASFAIGTSGLGPGEQMLHCVLEYGRVELIHHRRTVTLRADQFRVPQHGQVPRDGWPGRIERLGEVTRGFRSGAQQSQDFAPGRVRECLEDCVRSCHCLLSRLDRLANKLIS